MNKLLLHMADVGRLMERLNAHYDGLQPSLLSWELERIEIERLLIEALTNGEELGQHPA